MKNSTLIPFLGLLFLIHLSIFSCTNDKLVSPDPVNQEGVSCDPDLIYFVSEIQPILTSNCAYSGCHGDGSAEDDVDLSSYALILATGGVKPGNARDSKLYKVMTKTDPSDIMPPPPSAPVSNEQILKIEQWINQGALNNECISTANCDTENVTFSNSIQSIVQNKCQGCHSGGAPQGGLSLTNYIEIKASVDSDRFLGSIRHQVGFAAMPPSGAKLPTCEIDQITQWINDGAPNN